MKRIFAAANAVVAISAGIIVLGGYLFVDTPVLAGFRIILFQWAIILAGVATLVGIANLFSVHLQKLRERQRGSINSLVLLSFLIVSLLINSADIMAPYQRILLDGIMIPAEISLMAVLAVTLIYSIIRLLRVRANLASMVFVITALIVLVGIAPWPLIGQIPLLSDWVRPFVTDVLASGGARGILIGVALGTITTGLRILLGTDRPYGGK